MRTPKFILSPYRLFLMSFNMWHLCILFFAQEVISKNVVYPVWTLSSLNNNAIVLCNKCYDDAKAQIVVGRKWPDGHILQRFKDTHHAWWLERNEKKHYRTKSGVIQSVSFVA